MPDSKAPVLVLANPSSGGGLAGELVPYLVRDLQRLDYPVEVFTSSRPGQITSRVRAARCPLSAIAVVGGDGTVREALQAEPDPAVPVAVLPAGTANVLALDMKLPKAPRETSAMIERGRFRLLDLGLIRREGGRPELFVLFVSAGTDARIVHQVHEKRAGGTLKKLDYVAPILGSILRFEGVPHWFVLENGERHGPFEQVLVTNIRSYGPMWKLPGAIEMDDGLLDCLGFRVRSGGALLRWGLRGTFNLLRESEDLVHMQAARVRIESAEQSPVQVDGDPGGNCPVEVEIEPDRLRLLVP